METEKKFNVEESITAQRNLIHEKGYPDFPPGDGICFRCRRQIYSPVWWITENGWRRREAKQEKAESVTGVDIEKAKNELITGCPHCNYSFCS